MKKSILILPMLLIGLISCDFPIHFPWESNSAIESWDVSQSESISQTNSETGDNLIEDEFLTIDPEIKLFVGERYYLGRIIKGLRGIKLSYEATLLDYKDEFIQALAEGECNLKFILNGYYQAVKIKISKEDLMMKDFKFDIEHLKGKRMVCFGDSVTADATVANEGSEITYPWLLKNNMEMAYVKNYAIGGTTATYTYFGSNIYKEYATNNTAIDGPRVVKKAYENGELNNIDYAIIAYGHNDQYFQPPLDNDNLTDGLSLENCKSFKQSYRYMIGMIKKASPNCRIIILNCTYSQYQSGYGSKYTYQDYRNAEKEIADEYNLKCLDPWSYLENYYKKGGYYKDVVHLNKKGQNELYSFIISQ